MSITASASEVQKNFGSFHDRALSEPVPVTKYGRETVYIVSAETFHRLKQSDRAALASEDLRLRDRGHRAGGDPGRAPLQPKGRRLSRGAPDAGAGPRHLLRLPLA